MIALVLVTIVILISLAVMTRSTTQDPVGLTRYIEGIKAPADPGR
ncbi:MAG: hypothetical protein N2689_16910 [Verrucomicrobiae bacterium]|nr:hypothetical protein [Verrucomicrobiae bacterium]